MSLHHLLPPPDEPEPREPWPGEEEALAQAAAAGRRAAAWIRKLPHPPGDTWITGRLPDAVEDALTSLDPGDETALAPDARGGLPETTEQTLAGLIYAMPEASACLTPEQQIALLAIVHCAAGIPRLLANDPGTVITDGELAALCKVLDFATRT
ncbi:hypothetical protein ABZ135_23440 [Streptomyces sp. NPDC006339]|uniref:hypothetical protein n=1 Tax=Streptomyces sp. NPDC006339 TaxID=3156755 RepID=UPI0033BB0BD7